MPSRRSPAVSGMVMFVMTVPSCLTTHRFAVYKNEHHCGWLAPTLSSDGSTTTTCHWVARPPVWHGPHMRSDSLLLLLEMHYYAFLFMCYPTGQGAQ